MFSNMFLIIAVAAAVIGVVGFAHKHWPRSDEQKFDKLYRRFCAEHGGASFDEQQVRFSLLMAAARLRRLASAEVMRNPGAYQEIISRIAKDEAMKFATRDRAVGRAFAAWASETPTSDILYEDAYKLAMTWKPMKTVMASKTDQQDAIAALTVL